MYESSHEIWRYFTDPDSLHSFSTSSIIRSCKSSSVVQQRMLHLVYISRKRYLDHTRKMIGYKYFDWCIITHHDKMASFWELNRHKLLYLFYTIKKKKFKWNELPNNISVINEQKSLKIYLSFAPRDLKLWKKFFHFSRY